MGSAAYSYYFVVEALAPVLEALGTWRLIDHPESRLAFAASEGRGRRVPAGPPGDQPAPGRLPEPDAARTSSSRSGSSPTSRPRLRLRHPAELGPRLPARARRDPDGLPVHRGSFRRAGSMPDRRGADPASPRAVPDSPTGIPATPGRSPAATRSGAAPRRKRGAGRPARPGPTPIRSRRRPPAGPTTRPEAAGATCWPGGCSARSPVAGDPDPERIARTRHPS